MFIGCAEKRGSHYIFARENIQLIVDEDSQTRISGKPSVDMERLFLKNIWRFKELIVYLQRISESSYGRCN